MKDVVERANIAIVDAQDCLNITDGWLRCKEHYTSINKLLAEYNKVEAKGLFSKIKSVMVEKSSYEIERDKELADKVYMLEKCIECKCVNCVRIEDTCRCVGCMYGSKCVECDGKVRINDIDTSVVDMQGSFYDVTSSTDLINGKTKIYGKNDFGDLVLIK